MATAAQWIQGARLRTLPAAIAPVLIGSAAAYELHAFRLPNAILAALVALLLQIGVNYANDYSDGIRGTDEDRVGPLRLFGHCMGAVVAFEFARVAEQNSALVHSLWASAGQAPCDVVGAPPLPTGPREMLAEMVDLGGTDPRLLADPDFVELLLMAVGADYAALNRYLGGGRIAADIHALGGRDDHRIDQDMLRRWENHTSGAFTLTEFDGGHFYLNDHLDALADVISAR